MKTSRIAALTIIFSFLNSSRPAHAGLWEFNIGPGYMSPVGSLSSFKDGEGSSDTTAVDLKGAPSIQAGLFHWFDAPLALGLEGGITPGLKVNETRTVSGIPISGSSDQTLIDGLVSLKVGKKPRSAADAFGYYGILGAGVYLSNQNASMTLTGSSFSVRS